MRKGFVVGLMMSAATIAVAQDGRPANGQVTRISGGIAVSLPDGPVSRVELTVHGDGAFHVVKLARGGPVRVADASLMAPAPPRAGDFTLEQSNGHALLRTVRDSADVDLATGHVRFLDAGGRVLLNEAGGPRFAPTTSDGQRFVSVSQQFNHGTDEGLYGLGQHQNRQMDYNGEDVELAQHNMDIAIPFLVSTKGYGLLWDNNGITRFGNPRPYRLVGDDLSVTSEGRPGFTAHYYLGDRLAVTRQERVVDYQYIRDQKNYPDAARSATVHATGGQNTAGNAVQEQRVVWTGDVATQVSGTHKFQLYGSSYYKVFMDGHLVLDRWRQNWNPWYANFEYPMVAGRPVKVRIEWQPNQGYIAFLHNDPLPPADRHSVWFTSDVAHAEAYWFVPGRGMDDVIAGYRRLTGRAPMMPAWAYGFWQSRQRYTTQDEVTGVVRRYRALGIPIDNIVQDWFYWPEDAWGSHAFDPARFPRPQQWVDDVHALHAHLMISVWPKFYPTTANYRELEAKGHTYRGSLAAGYKDWVGPGYQSTDYDPYSPEARAIYWRQIRDRLARLGIDAWWLDASEPDLHSNLSIEERQAIMGPTALGPAAAYFNSFPLMHATAVADGWHAFKPDTRGFILTRSGFAGMQRASAAVWSGDVASRWYDLRAQISAGVNLSMSGLPNWTHDIGGFTNETRFSTAHPTPADLAEWRELNLRWFEFGAFSPLFRSHGEAPAREIYEISPEGSPMRAAMIRYDELRYRLMPYIYTLAADTWFRDGSIMRGLVMDWPNDPRARRIDDEYMLGDAFLVAPVTDYRARRRQVYLPAAAGWYEWNTGERYTGGQSVSVDAPLDRLPLFVRAGAIVPTGPVRQYVGEKPDAPVTLLVYPGADGQASVYADDGTSNGYLQGRYSRMPVRYDDRTGTVTLGAREGAGYAGAPTRQTVRIRWMVAGRPADLNGPVDATVTWTGAPITVPAPGRAGTLR